MSFVIDHSKPFESQLDAVKKYVKRFSIVTVKTVAGQVKITQPHLFLGLVKGTVLYGPDDLMSTVLPIELYVNDVAKFNPELLSEIEFRDAGSVYDFSATSAGSIDAVIVLILKGGLQ